MSQQNMNDTVDNLVEDGRQLLRKANRRHVVVRKADGTTLVDLNLTTVAIIVIAIFVIQPLGTLLALGAIGYGIYNKLRIEVTHELTEEDDVVEVNIPREE